MVLRPKIRIPINSLLRGPGPTLSLEEAQAFLAVSELTGQNLWSVSEDDLKAVDLVYGPAGTWQLVQLAMSVEKSEFEHFWDLIRNSITFESVTPTGEDLQTDNAALLQADELARFAWNLVQPSLSRKLYRAGRHHGSVVYGLGGPRILVSHPFRGIAGETYDLYNNSLDVVTSLYMRGYFGTFHFLDYLPGLNYDVDGVNAWLLWFSLIAGHSDLVVYIKEYEGGFGPSQQGEIAFTPNRVNRKIVEIPHDELSWAKETPEAGDLPIMRVGRDGVMSVDQWYAMEAEHAAPLVEAYRREGIPDDMLYRIDEEQQVTSYALDYDPYEFPDS